MKNERLVKLAAEEAQLKERITAIQKERVQERENDLVRIVEVFREELAAHELTIDEAVKLLGVSQTRDFSTSAKSTSGASKKSAAKAKYKDSSGPGTWAGVGRKPHWLVEALAGGKTLESFRIAS